MPSSPMPGRSWNSSWLSTSTVCTSLVHGRTGSVLSSEPNNALTSEDFPVPVVPITETTNCLFAMSSVIFLVRSTTSRSLSYMRTMVVPAGARYISADTTHMAAATKGQP